MLASEAKQLTNNTLRQKTKLDVIYHLVNIECLRGETKLIILSCHVPTQVHTQLLKDGYKVRNFTYDDQDYVLIPDFSEYCEISWG